MSAVVYRLPTAAPEKVVNPRKYGPWAKSGMVDGSFWSRLQARQKAEYLVYERENARRWREYRAAEAVKALQATVKGQP